MKRTLLLAATSLVFGASPALAKSDLETLRVLCAEQERQIRQLEDENAKLRSLSDQPSKNTKAADKSVTQTAAANKSATKTAAADKSVTKAAAADKSGTTPVMANKSGSPATSAAKTPASKVPVPTATNPKAAVATSKTAPLAKPSIRSVTLTGTTTYGEFAKKHGTDVRHLNDLNALDLVETTVLAKGSELYIPAQP